MKLMKLANFLLPFGRSRLVRSGNLRLIGRFTAVSAIVAINSLLAQASAQPIIVPQHAPYANDAYTVLLEHFDGTTTGSANGSVIYTNGVFGQGVHLNDGSWISWNLGRLAQATVEFWGKLDTLNYGGLQPSFIQSDDAQFFGSTFDIMIITNYAFSSYNCDCDPPSHNNWVGMTNGIIGLPSAALVTANSWHHYASTWGSQGFHFYIDGRLVYTNSNTYAQSPYTAWWAIGGLIGGGPASPSGFTGVIDELRISNIQRTFSGSPLGLQVSLIKAVKPSFNNLMLTTNYQLQVSADMSTWTNQGPVFTATNTSMVYPQYWDVDNWNSLYFRLLVAPQF